MHDKALSSFIMGKVGVSLLSQVVFIVMSRILINFVCRSVKVYRLQVDYRVSQTLINIQCAMRKHSS